MATITIMKCACLPVTDWEEANIWAGNVKLVTVSDAFFTEANLKEVWADVRNILRPDAFDLSNIYGGEWSKDTMRNIAACAWFSAQ